MIDEPVELVDSVGPLDRVVVALREFLHVSGAVRAVGVLPQPVAGDEEAVAIVECGRLAPTEVTLPDRSVLLAHAAPLEAAAPDFGELRQLPVFEVRRDAGELAAPLGGAEHYARGVRHLAAVLGPGAVALATWESSDPDAPLSISARGEDPIVLVLGEDEYEQDPGWPPA